MTSSTKKHLCPQCLQPLTNLSEIMKADWIEQRGCLQCDLVVELSTDGKKVVQSGLKKLMVSIALFLTACDYNLGRLDFRGNSQWDGWVS